MEFHLNAAIYPSTYEGTARKTNSVLTKAPKVSFASNSNSKTPKIYLKTNTAKRLRLPTAKRTLFGSDFEMRQHAPAEPAATLRDHLRDTLHALPELARRHNADNISLLRAATHARSRCAVAAALGRASHREEKIRLLKKSR